MSDKDDKILKPTEWIGIIVAGIAVVAVFGWSASSGNAKQRALEALSVTEDCKDLGVFVDVTSEHGTRLRSMYECDDGAFKRFVIK